MIDLFNEIVKEYGNEKGIFIIIGFGMLSLVDLCLMYFNEEEL